MKRTYKKNTFILVIMTLIESIIIKTLQFKLLPSKYFYDSNKILTMMLSGIRFNDKSYDFTANLFNSINIFNFTTLKQWSYFIGIIFSVIMALILLKKEKYLLKEYLFIYASIGLLNIYVFNLSKDIIQFIYFLFIYLILKKEKYSNSKKMFLVILVLLIETFTFRAYYGIMAMILCTMYLIYELFLKSKKIDKKKIIKIIFLTLLFFFVEIYLVQIVSKENYNLILNSRYSVNIFRENSADAKTIIKDLLGVNKTYFIFIGNYLINFIRLLFPIELIFKGFKYVLFIVYQLFISINLLKSCKKINSLNFMWIIVALSYLIVSIIFEPDFGSFIRHESAIILILLEIMDISYNNYDKKVN